MAADNKPGDIKRGTFARIRRFVRGDGVRMVFQPIADLNTGSVIGFESLARFDTTPTRSPAIWFDEATAAGLRRELELATVRAAVASLRDLPESVYLTLNASPDVAVDPAFIDAIAEIPGARVVVEITENAPIEDYDSLNRTLSTLRARGIRVAIDDAGAGFANMSHILRIDADLIKLDIEITRHIDIDARRRALVRSLVEFARSVGASIVAEGIETEAELDALRALGVTAGQGYHLGRPEPIDPPVGRRSTAPRRRRFPSAVVRAVADARSFASAKRAARRTAGSRRRIVRPAAVALVGALVLAPATFAFADGAAPNTPGYWLKQRIEDVRLLVALDDRTEVQLHLDFARRRMDELNEALADERTGVAPMLLADFRGHVEAIDRGVGDGRLIAGPGFQARIVSELNDYVAALDAGRSVLCGSDEASRECGDVDAATKTSKATLARAKRRAPAVASPATPASGTGTGRAQPATPASPASEPESNPTPGAKGKAPIQPPAKGR